MFLILHFRRLSSSTPHRDCSVGLSRPCQTKVYGRRKVLWKFTCLSSVVEKRSTKDQYIKIDLAQSLEGWGSFRDIDGASSERSLFPGDVSAPRKIDDKLCYIFCLFILVKLLKQNTKKGVNGVGFVASLGVHLQPWSTLSAACLSPTGSAAVKKKCASMPCRLFWLLVSFGRWKTL